MNTYKTADQQNITVPIIMRSRCKCGKLMGPSGECANCQRKRVGIQPKLRVNQPNDKYEQEADCIADQVMRMSSAPSEPLTMSPVQVRRKGDGGGEVVSAETATQINQLQTGGQPLPDTIRHYFEPRFGHDFRHVRVHTDNIAAKTAQAINAQAYTIGKNIVFGRNYFSIESIAVSYTHLTLPTKRIV